LSRLCCAPERIAAARAPALDPPFPEDSDSVVLLRFNVSSCEVTDRDSASISFDRSPATLLPTAEQVYTSQLAVTAAHGLKLFAALRSFFLWQHGATLIVMVRTGVGL
jgi:hypothetical protein